MLKATSKSEQRRIQLMKEEENKMMIEAIAVNIANLASSVKSLLNGPLKKKAIVILLAQSSQLPQIQVEKVLKALEDLEADWLK